MSGQQANQRMSNTPYPTDFDVRVRWSEYIPHEPTEKQHAYLWVNTLEALFGGQVGGGKSDALLMSALQYVDVPGYAALLLRKSYPDLAQPGAIMSRAKDWLRGTGVKWNENNKEFLFPSGAKVAFGYLKRDEDVYQYQSAEYQFIGFDELTQFTEFQYTYMLSRLRRVVGMRVPLRVRSGTNPGGKGHHWVRRYFIKEGRENGRVFIPSALEDNPHLDQESYRKSLEHLDPYTKAQLLHGDWSARPPGNWAFDHEHLDAVFRYGADTRKERQTKGIGAPVGGKLHSGIDFGEASHVLAIWPLEMGSVWVPKEHVYEHGEPDREARVWMRKVENLGYTLDRSRFDSSKPESMRLFYRELKEARGAEYGRPSPVPFNKWKRAAILHVRGMASRTAWGEKFGALGIDSQGCPILEQQLYELKFKGEDTEDLVKEDDHGPDALFAGIAPEIRRWVPPEEKPQEAQEKQEKQEKERVAAFSAG